MEYIFAARKQFAGRCFRGKIFSREEIFAGILYFRVNSIFAKISSRENISNSLFAKISSRENNVLYSSCLRLFSSNRMESAWPSMPSFKIDTLWPEFLKTHLR